MINRYLCANFNEKNISNKKMNKLFIATGVFIAATALIYGNKAIQGVN